MAGLVAAIHILIHHGYPNLIHNEKFVDARHKAGYDEILGWGTGWR
jgi:hypothetical protein